MRFCLDVYRNNHSAPYLCLKAGLWAPDLPCVSDPPSAALIYFIITANLFQVLTVFSKVYVKFLMGVFVTSSQRTHQILPRPS